MVSFPRQLGGAEPALAHDQLEVLGGHFTYNDGLQHAELADGGGQLAQVILVKDVTRLPGVGDDLAQRQLDEIGSVTEPVGGGGGVAGVLLVRSGEEVSQTLTEAHVLLSPGHQAAPSSVVAARAISSAALR